MMIPASLLLVQGCVPCGMEDAADDWVTVVLVSSYRVAGAGLCALCLWNGRLLILMHNPE